jgi:antitoxin (DNA-binding transcriptional repressor) of toxin-antitoxin stability system
MKKAVITVTAAARNFADCVNRAHYQNTAFILVKNGKPVARLEPAHEKACTGRELAEALEKTDLSAAEARAWRKDLLTSRRKLSPPGNKWR